MFSPTVTANLVGVSCCNCGVMFAMTEDYIRERRRDHRNFYCPNGHTQHWPQETPEESLRKQLTLERAKRDQAEAAAREAVKEAGRVKQRTANGVCPCCNRTFVSLARHIKAKHPKYATPTTGGRP